MGTESALCRCCGLRHTSHNDSYAMWKFPKDRPSRHCGASSRRRLEHVLTALSVWSGPMVGVGFRARSTTRQPQAVFKKLNLLN
jgi:hypothetical protein